MKKKFVISMIVATVMLSSTAQINLPSLEGYHSRALLMYQDANYDGCIDQFSKMLEMNPTFQQRETAHYYIAMSALALSEDNAEMLLRNFLKDYPASLYRMDVEMAIGDYYFKDEDYAAALAQYNNVVPLTLTGTRVEDYNYRKSYSQLKLADYAEADKGFKQLLSSKKYGNSAKFYAGYIAYTKNDYDTANSYFDQVDSASELGDMTDYYKSQIYFINKDYKKAISLAKKLLDKDVDLLYIAEANRIVGESLYNQGDIVSAIPYLQEYVKSVEEPLPSTRYILGVSQYKSQDYKSAIENLEGVTSENNAMGQSAYLLIGQSLLKQGDCNAAMMALDKAVKMNHDLSIQEVAFYNYAVAGMQGGTIPFGSSVANFEEFLLRYPNSPYVPQVQQYIVSGYMSENNYEKVLSVIEGIKQPNEELLKAKQRALYSLGVRELTDGKVDSAISFFKESKHLAGYDNMLSQEADLWLGDCYYAKGEYDMAAVRYLAYVDSVDDDAANLSLAYYNLGYTRFKSKRYDDAIVNFENALDEPENLDKSVIADAYCRIADCYYFKTDFASATKNYDKAYAANPATGDYPLFQKAMMKGNVRDISGKIKTLDDVLEQYPSSGIIPSVLLEKAECYVAQEKYNKAIETYSQLIKQYPTTAQGRNGRLQLAITYLNRGNRNQAIDTYKSVITNYPTSDEARIASQDLMKLYAEDNNLESYTAFMSTIPDAVPVERTEIEEAAYLAAEAAYMDGKGVGQFKKYLVQYPGSSYEPSVLSQLAVDEFENDNEEKALEYANEIITRYPDNVAVESALNVKAEIEYNQGKNELAYEDFRKLEKCASSSNTRMSARMGVMRVAYELGKYDVVIEKSNELLSAQIDADVKSEVMFDKAVALNNTGNAQEAISIWSSLDDNAEDIYGAMSAVELSQYYCENNELKDARSVVEEFINSSTPHQYWLARGYIILSDINRKEGKTFEANEYLRTLRDNYPGGDADIFKMIDERLK